MKKRILSLALALVLSLSLLPSAVFAAEDFAPFERLLAQIIYDSKAEVFGTFLDFDGDGASELIAMHPGNNGTDPILQIYRLRHDSASGYYYENLLERHFHVVTGGSSQYLAGIVENQAGEVGVLMHTEGTTRVDEPEHYKGLIGDYAFDTLYIWRGGRFVQQDDAELVIWHTEPDAAGNVYYDPDLGWIHLNNATASLEEYQAWSDRFTNSISVYAWLSPDEALDGLHEDELLSLAKVGFYDVLYAEYYAEPVRWAAAKGITNGTADYEFSPENPCTRGQVVTFLWRAAGSPAPKSRVNPFRDVAADAYYYKAVLWAVENGVTKGTSETAFSPESPCTRGQVVTFLHRNAKTPKVAAANPFRDVAAGAYYYDAVLWAVKNGVTNGTSAAAFSPDQTCTRGQIVTFLYRSLSK